jgi:hypothetical protein
MLRLVLVLAVLGCHHPASPPTIGNAASSALPQVPPPTSKALDRARVYLARANALAARGAYLLAYADAQRGINVLDGDPDLDNGALLEASQTKAAQEELVIMTELRTRELARRISKR